VLLRAQPAVPRLVFLYLLLEHLPDDSQPHLLLEFGPSLLVLVVEAADVVEWMCWFCRRERGCSTSIWAVQAAADVDITVLPSVRVVRDGTLGLQFGTCSVMIQQNPAEYQVEATIVQQIRSNSTRSKPTTALSLSLIVQCVDWLVPVRFCMPEPAQH